MPAWMTIARDAATYASMHQSSPHLDELDRLLLEQSDDFMLLSQLDGFLTGFVVSPDLVSPSRWLKQIWASDDGKGKPSFEDASQLQRLVDLSMRHYNAIIGTLGHAGRYEPILKVDPRNDDVLWEMGIEGFGQAMDLAPEGWVRMAADQDAGCTAGLAGIRSLRALFDGSILLTHATEDRWDKEAADLIPTWVDMLHQWRVENDPHRSQSVKREKVGRNDPCPCGAGKKYKKCCGLN